MGGLCTFEYKDDKNQVALPSQTKPMARAQRGGKPKGKDFLKENTTYISDGRRSGDYGSPGQEDWTTFEPSPLSNKSKKQRNSSPPLKSLKKKKVPMNEKAPVNDSPLIGQGEQLGDPFLQSALNDIQKWDAQSRQKQSNAGMLVNKGATPQK